MPERAQQERAPQPASRPAAPVQRREAVPPSARHGATGPRVTGHDRALNGGSRTAGERALQARFDGGSPRAGILRPAPPVPGTGAPVQRLEIAGEHIYPTGKNGKALLDKVRFAMLTAGLSPHGTSKKFREVAKKDLSFGSESEFVNAFVQEGRAETQRVEEARALEKQKPKSQRKEIRGWTRALKMNRPSWPESYKSVVKKGEDIRHIVRNATLKNAIEAERSYQVNQNGEQAAGQVMADIAEAMGADPATHSFDSMTNIYARAYLNPGNLFPGSGSVNRVIGLTADRITQLGANLLRSDGFAQPDQILDVFEQVEEIVDASVAQMERQANKMGSTTSSTFLEDFDLFAENIRYYLDARGKELAAIAERDPEELDLSSMDTTEDVLVGVTDAQIGRELIDIGANFGFDLPPEALESDHMQALIKTEILLANYQPGNPQRLAEILVRFMNVKNLMGV